MGRVVSALLLVFAAVPVCRATEKQCSAAQPSGPRTSGCVDSNMLQRAAVRGVRGFEDLSEERQQLFQRVDVLETGGAAANASTEFAAWLREVGAVGASHELRPQLEVQGDHWRLAIPMSRSRAEGNGAATCRDAPGTDARVFIKGNGRGDLCVVGHGFQSRASSTVAMIAQAVALLRTSGKSLPLSTAWKSICIEDHCPCVCDFGSWMPDGAECGKSIPDFSMWAWPEAGIVPDFKHVSKRIEEVGKSPPERQVCGWAGSRETHGAIWSQFEAATKDTDKYDIFVPVADQGTEGRLSMDEQTRRWACMLDLPPQSSNEEPPRYSGRVPMLLHSGRPLLMVQRSDNLFLDHVWYAPWLKPWVHFIPVHRDFHDLEAAVEVALSPRGQEIAANALSLARERLTTEASVKFIADLLVKTDWQPKTE